jgi:pyruvate, water dikinase
MWFRSSSGDVAKDGADPIQRKFRILRRLLAANAEMLELMAARESDLRHMDPGDPRLRQPILHLLECSLLMAEHLNLLAADRYRALYQAQAEIERLVRVVLQASVSPAGQPLLVRLKDASRARASEVGGKAASLGELRAVMPEAVPGGFVVTTAGYRLFMQDGNLQDGIRKLFRDLSLLADRSLFAERTAAMRTLMRASAVPREVAEAIATGVAGLAVPPDARWAVRSSAVGEDGGRWSFAGQFDSLLNVSREGLLDAYKAVLASRYADRAITYRLLAGFAEVETPMAVLLLPMLEARAAGVLYTRDPRDPASDKMLVNSVAGLADAMLRGDAEADMFLVGRGPGGKPQRAGDRGRQASLSDKDLERLVELGHGIEKHFGGSQDIEWVLTRDDRLMVVQSRPLHMQEGRIQGSERRESRPAILTGGMTIFAGRAVGPVEVVTSTERLTEVAEGAVLVVRQATPELGPIIPILGGIVAEEGSAAGHAATLVREFGIPAVFGVKDASSLLKAGTVVSLDATHRRVYEGALWPGVEDQGKERIARWRSGERSSPLGELILTLHLTDPRATSFRASQCRSVHDIVRFAHEKAVATMFELGDEAVSGRRRTWQIESSIPLSLTLMDLGGAVPEASRSKRALRPEAVASVPFRALWRGIADPRVQWAGRAQISLAGFASVMAASMVDAPATVRALGDRNYVVVAPEYMNLNARLAYHFAMIDAVVTDVSENNYVSFRFRGGGAGEGRRDRRARFLESVLLRTGFGVERKGDLVTSWARRLSAEHCEASLATLGRLMACARQLDMLMDDDGAVGRFAERFLSEDFAAFG